MKKTNCILLILTIVLSCLAVSACCDNEFSEELKKEVIEDYLLWSGVVSDKTIDEIEYEYFGTYGESVAIYFHTSGAYEIPTKEKVGGFTFKYPDSRVIRIWNNGNFYKMCEALEIGLISNNDILDIKFKSLFLKIKEPYFIYSEKYLQEISSSIYTKPELYCLNELYVFIDPMLCRNGSLITLSFFNNHELIKGIERKEWLDMDFGEVYTVYLHSNTVEELISVKEYIENIDGVRRVELEGGWELATSSNDIHYSNGDLWGLEKIEIDKVWDFTTGSKNVYVGVIDTGIASHEDLDDNLMIGWDFLNENSVTDDVLGHGTHVAGIIGAVGNNEIGVVGVNWSVGGIPLQIRDERLFTRHEDIIEAVNYGKSYPARILNMSFTNDQYDIKLFNAISSYPGLIVCAAGQNNQNIDEYPVYPAFYGSKVERNVDRVENIIVVGAIDQNENIAYIDTVCRSNYGENTVNIYAPGREIYSTSINNSYVLDSGTSMATPYVTGVAALLLSINPDLTTAQLKECILNGAKIISIYVGENYDILKNVKMLNAWGAFQYLMENYPYDSHNVGYSSSVQYTYNVDADASYMKDHTAMMKLVIDNQGEYNFTITSENEMNVVLYNSELTQLQNVTCDEVGEMTRYMYPGVYYLRINYTDSNSEGIITVDMDCPTHIHSYSEYTCHSDTEHIAERPCTYTLIEEHSMYTRSAGNGQHAEKCIDCGYIDESTREAHSYDYWVYVNTTTHVSECGCGARGTTTANHVFGFPDPLTGEMICRGCGYTKIYGSDNGNIILGITKVSVNGSYILPDGNIVLADEDVEAYFNGTLAFYDKDKVPVTQ